MGIVLLCPILRHLEANNKLIDVEKVAGVFMGKYEYALGSYNYDGKLGLRMIFFEIDCILNEDGKLTAYLGLTFPQLLRPIFTICYFRRLFKNVSTSSFDTRRIRVIARRRV